MFVVVLPDERISDQIISSHFALELERKNESTPEHWLVFRDDIYTIRCADTVRNLIKL